MLELIIFRGLSLNVVSCRGQYSLVYLFQYLCPASCVLYVGQPFTLGLLEKVNEGQNM